MDALDGKSKLMKLTNLEKIVADPASATAASASASGGDPTSFPSSGADVVTATAVTSGPAGAS